LLLLKKTKHQHQGAKRQYRLFSNDFFLQFLPLLKKTKHGHQGEKIKNNFNSNYFCHLPLLLKKTKHQQRQRRHQS